MFLVFEESGQFVSRILRVHISSNINPKSCIFSMGNKSSVTSLKMFPVDKGVAKSLEEEVQRLAIDQVSDDRFDHIQRNPLLIAEVIENLFPYMDFQSQLASRLVCKLWEYISTPSLRSKAHIHFRKLERDYASVFSQDLELSNIFPISKVTLELPIKGPSPAAIGFFEQHGHNIRELTLIPCRTSDCRTFVEFLSSILDQFCPNLKYLALTKLHFMSFRDISFPPNSPALPNLKSLKVELAETYMYSYPYHGIAFLKELLARTPNLEKLATDFGYSKNLFVKFFNHLREVGTNATLVDLDLQHSRLSNAQLDALLATRFPKLKALRIDSLADNSVGDRLKEFLRSVSPSLEKLVLDGDVGNQKTIYRLHQRNEAGLKMRFPVMEKLKVFENRNVEGYQIGTIGFVYRKFPNVQEVLLEDFGIWALYKAAPWQDLFPDRIISESSRLNLRNIRKLSMNTTFRCYDSNLRAFGRMVKYMPMINEFETMVSLLNGCKGLGTFLATLSTINISKFTLHLKDGFLQELSDIRNYEEAFKTHFPSFKQLQKLEFRVDDMQIGTKFRLKKEVILEGICRIENLTALTLVGIEFASEEEGKIYQALWKKLAYLEMKDIDESLDLIL